ncbi:MAG: MBL fold metallo-hydrolase [Deltaproteobacteria bacterium]|nr:MBL fold metallo-hydrolase [Deltaproteobacteria bacterium]
MTLHEAVRIHNDLWVILYKPTAWPSSSYIYLIEDQGGLTIIDARIGTDAVFDSVLKCLAEQGFDPSLIHTILLTHAHTDHIGGISKIKHLSNPRILIPELDVPEATDPVRHVDDIMSPRIRSYYAEKLKGWDLSRHLFDTCGDWLLDENDQMQVIKDGDEIRAGRYLFEAIWTPGHDVGEMVYWEPEHKMLFTGDLLKTSGTGLPWYSRASGGIDAYLKSLEKIKKLNVKRVLPSHGVMDKTFEEGVVETRDIILGRERKILRALEKGPKSLKELDRTLFPEWFWNMSPWVSSITDAHLCKLETEGILRQADGRFFMQPGTPEEIHGVL